MKNFAVLGCLYFFLEQLILLYNFLRNVTFAAPLDKHSSPKDPTPENKSRIFEFSTFISNNLECLIILKIDSLVKSLRGLVNLSLGSRIFLPL